MVCLNEASPLEHWGYHPSGRMLGFTTAMDEGNRRDNLESDWLAHVWQRLNDKKMSLVPKQQQQPQQRQQQQRRRRRQQQQIQV
jgi:hypothetical protein